MSLILCSKPVTEVCIKNTDNGNDNEKSRDEGHFYETHAKEHNPKLPTNDVAAAVSLLKVIKAASLSQKSGTTTASSSKRNIFFSLQIRNLNECPRLAMASR